MNEVFIWDMIPSPIPRAHSQFLNIARWREKRESARVHAMTNLGERVTEASWLEVRGQLVECGIVLPGVRISWVLVVSLNSRQKGTVRGTSVCVCVCVCVRGWVWGCLSYCECRDYSLSMLAHSFKVCSALESSLESNLQDRFNSLAICRRISWMCPTCTHYNYYYINDHHKRIKRLTWNSPSWHSLGGRPMPCHSSSPDLHSTC